MNDGSLSPDDFLTPQTAEGLRMTLKSTLDLSKYLLQNLKMEAVYTGRINQDSLEVLDSARQNILCIKFHKLSLPIIKSFET